MAPRVKDLKAAAAQQDKSASQLLEEAAREYLERWEAARNKKR